MREEGGKREGNGRKQGGNRERRGKEQGGNREGGRGRGKKRTESRKVRRLGMLIF